MTLYIMKTHSVLTAIMCLTMASCEIVKIEADMPMSKTQSIEPFDDASFKVTPVNAGDLIEILYPEREISSIDYITEGQDTLVHIYNFTKGWIAISGDKRAKPILGQSETGSLKAKGNPQGIDTWLGTRIDDILAYKNSNDLESNDNVDFWKHVIPQSKRTKNPNDVITRSDIEDNLYWVLRYDYEEVASDTVCYSVPHLLNTKWGQGHPWNYKCPYGFDGEGTMVTCPTGCTAVAMAQVIYYMHYFKGKPSGLYHDIECNGVSYNKDNYNITFSRGGYTENSPRWDLMAHNRYGTSTNYVGDLMMDVGNRVEMTYSGIGSGAFPSSEGFSHYSLTCKNGDYSVSTVNTNLNNGLPVIVVAYANKYKTGMWPFKKTRYSEGHTWVIDGKVEHRKIFKKHYYWTLTDEIRDTDMDIYPYIEKEYFIPDVYEGMPYSENRIEVSNYYLMNWGYDGRWDDGLYASGSPEKWSANNKNFQYDISIYYDIQ